MYNPDISRHMRKPRRTKCAIFCILVRLHSRRKNTFPPGTEIIVSTVYSSTTPFSIHADHTFFHQDRKIPKYKRYVRTFQSYCGNTITSHVLHVLPLRLSWNPAHSTPNSIPSRFLHKMAAIAHPSSRYGAQTQNQVPATTAQEVLTDDQLVQSWLYGKAVATKRGYKARFVEWAHYIRKRHLKLRDIKLHHAQAYLSSLERKQIMTRPVAAILKSFYRFATTTGHISRNPLDSLRLGKQPPPKVARKLTKSQIRKIIATSKAFKKRGSTHYMCKLCNMPFSYVQIYISDIFPKTSYFQCALSPCSLDCAEPN